MRRSSRGLFALAFCTVVSAPALAGIADGPLPVLAAGQTTLHVYSVPGALKGLGLEPPFNAPQPILLRSQWAFRPTITVECSRTTFPLAMGPSHFPRDGQR